MINFVLTDIIDFKKNVSIVNQNIKFLMLETKKKAERLLSDIEHKLSDAYKMKGDAQRDLAFAKQTREQNLYMLSVLKQRLLENQKFLNEANNKKFELYNTLNSLPKPSSVPRPVRMEGETDNQFQGRLGEYQEVLKVVRENIEKVEHAIYELDERIKTAEENVRILEEKIAYIEKLNQELENIIKTTTKEIEIIEKHIGNLGRVQETIKKSFQTLSYDLEMILNNIEIILKNTNSVQKILEDGKFENCRISSPNVIYESLEIVNRQISNIKKSIDNINLDIADITKKIKNVEFVDISTKKIEDFSTELRFEYLEKLEQQKETLQNAMHILEQYLSCKLK